MSYSLRWWTKIIDCQSDSFISSTSTEVMYFVNVIPGTGSKPGTPEDRSLGGGGDIFIYSCLPTVKTIDF